MYPILMHPQKIKLQPDVSRLYIEKQNKIFFQPINESAVSILSLCNGKNGVQDIINQLIKKYHEKEEKVSNFVKEFLNKSATFGTITWLNSPSPADIAIIGSSEFWTPDIMVIEVTHNCPLFCKHCFLNAGKKGISMELKELQKICKEIIALGVDMIQLTGGEPLIYPGIEKIISYICESNTKLFIATSGMIISSKIYEYLALIKNTGGWVQVSLDGLEATHNNLRGNPSSYSRAVKFITNLISKEVEVQVATCVTTESINEVEDLCKKVKDWGVRVHRIGVVSERGRAKENEIHSSVEFRKKVKNIKNNLKEKYSSPNFTISGFENEIKPEMQRNIKSKNCGAGYRTLKISPDYNIHPCPMMNLPLGNLKNMTLVDFIKKNSHLFAKLESPSEKYCMNCSNFPLCKGCMAEALLYREKVEKCKWFEKSQIKEILNDTFQALI